MTLCKEDSWRMQLVLDKNPGVAERIFFSEITIENGKITVGEVRNNDGVKLSNLSGTCRPLGEPGMSLMSFSFGVKGTDGKIVDVFMGGFAFDDGGTSKFQGRFLALQPGGVISQVDESGISQVDETGQLLKLALETDPGDTGTGTGQQT